MATKKVLKVLAAVYLILLTWIILFKMQFSLEYWGLTRTINLIPFGDSTITNGSVDLSEILYNGLVFIPIGVYGALLRPDWSIWQITGMSFGLSLSYEILQFATGLGRSDITDLIMNTAGGFVGALVFLIFTKIFGEKTRTILTVIASICTILLLLFLLLLFGFNH